MNTALTKEQHLAVDRYYWDGLIMNSLYRFTLEYAAEINKNKAWIERTHIRMTNAVAILDAVDPKDVRKHKDASIEVDNCTKLLARLTAETTELEGKYASTESQRAAIHARRDEHPFNGIVAVTSRTRYRPRCNC